MILQIQHLTTDKTSIMPSLQKFCNGWVYIGFGRIYLKMTSFLLCHDFSVTCPTNNVSRSSLITRSFSTLLPPHMMGRRRNCWCWWEVRKQEQVIIFFENMIMLHCLTPFARDENLEAVYMLGVINNYCHQDIKQSIYCSNYQPSMDVLFKLHSGSHSQGLKPKQASRHTAIVTEKESQHCKNFCPLAK